MSNFVFKKTKDISATYKLGKQLGQPGQFGVAKLCTNKTTKKKSAVKIIDKSKFQDAENFALALQDMKLEVETLKKFDHPNIIKLEEVYEDEDNLYLVQELCTGGELFDRITAKGKYSEKDAAGVLQQILKGIQAIHDKKIVHADLKPDNFLFLTPSDDAPLKIIDFGMAKKVPRDHFLRNMCGTPYYTAPEVIKGNYHRSADCWSVGVVMFVMLFGYPPFYVDPEKYGNKENEKIYAKISKGFVPITKDGFGRHFPASIKCSDDAKDLMKWLLRKDVAKRYTATQALDHKWFKSASGDPTISNNVARSIQKFTKANKFRMAMVFLFKDQLDKNQLEVLKKDFKAMDKDGDGNISKSEFREFMKKKAGSKKTNDEIESLFDALDVDGDSTLCFNELIQTVSDHQMSEVPERMWKIFRKIDLDQDGNLTSEEIKTALEGSKDFEWFKKMNIDIDAALKEADVDGDGKISYEEFVKALSPERPAKDADDSKEDEEDEGAAGLVGAVAKAAKKGEDDEKEAEPAPAPAKKKGKGTSLKM